MVWNWQLPDWPKFVCNFHLIAEQEKQFLLNAGSSIAFFKSIDPEEKTRFIIELLSTEGEKSAKIEGEILDRASLQSSIQRHFGLLAPKKENNKESHMAALLCDLFDSFETSLTEEMLCKWHGLLCKGQLNITDCGNYRTHEEAMQIISNRYGSHKIFFEAPPSKQVRQEMERFIKWFNLIDPAIPTLGRAAISHVYFESIHPFEDGNGRIGRLLIEKALSQGVGKPILVALSKILEKRKKEYYAALERCNQTLEIEQWVIFFANAVLEAQKESTTLLYFLIGKAKMFAMLSGQINLRQEKVLLRMFSEGPSGFTGGLSAENYISITKSSRATATRDLADLVQKGALVKTGELRHSRYWLNLAVTQASF